MSRKIFKEGKKYTFSDYFDLNNPLEEIINEFCYQLDFQEIEFHLGENIAQDRVENLKSFYYKLLPKITINSEIAKREFMIAPLLYEVILNLDAKLNVEYPLEVDDKLSGVIDYLIRGRQQELIVIEAKKGDLEKGFNQLTVEMIALDKYEENQNLNCIYGAITIGEVWRFCLLNRAEKKIIKDFNLYRYPQDIKDIFAILTGILTN